MYEGYFSPKIVMNYKSDFFILLQKYNKYDVDLTGFQVIRSTQYVPRVTQVITMKPFVPQGVEAMFYMVIQKDVPFC